MRSRVQDVLFREIDRIGQADPACGSYGAYLRQAHDRRRDPPPSEGDDVTNFDEK